MTALAGHHHVPSLLTGNEPGLSLLTARIGRRFSAGNSGVILGGIGASAFTVPDSLRRVRPAYSSPSQFFRQKIYHGGTGTSIAIGIDKARAMWLVCRHSGKPSDRQADTFSYKEVQGNYETYPHTALALLPVADSGSGSRVHRRCCLRWSGGSGPRREHHRRQRRRSPGSDLTARGGGRRNGDSAARASATGNGRYR